MTGATNHVCGTNEKGEAFLQFKFKMNPKMNHLRITLAGDDTYTLTFTQARAGKTTVVAEEEGIYADMLHDRIRAVTGLETRMPRFVR